jgi:adenylate kinase
MIAIIIYGPPGSGKGTQAQLLAERLGIAHFDTGRYLRKLLSDPRRQKNKIIQRERQINEAGRLNTPAWILKIVSQKVKKIAALDEGIIFSGSPRTLFEAFGNKKQTGLIQLLEKYYGKRNIFIFILKVPLEESLKRNSSRLFCSSCHSTLMGWVKKKINRCPFCGGKLQQRKDDRKEIIFTRLKEYQERTNPIIKELQGRRYKIINIDGAPAPYKIHQKIVSSLRFNQYI